MNNKPERFLCVECVKTMCGNEKFLDLITAEHSLSFSLEKEVIASRRNTAAKEIRKEGLDRIEDPCNILNCILEVK